jgi:hypothetical protein
MENENAVHGSPKWMTIVGWVLTVIATLMLLMSAAFKFLKVPDAVTGMQKFGWDESKLLLLGILEIGSLLIYLFPKTAVLGAIILAGYLGGATATHYRVGDVIWGPIMVGIFVWVGLWLREPRLRALTPFRS